MSAWVLVLVFAFAEGGATSAQVEMPTYEACAQARHEVADLSRYRPAEGVVRVAICLKRL